MSDVIRLHDGTNFLVRDDSDFIELLEEKIGRDAALYFEDYANNLDKDYERLDKAFDETRDRYQEKIGEIRELVHEAVKLITHTQKEMVNGKEIDLVKMSNLLGKISTITMIEWGRMK